MANEKRLIDANALRSQFPSSGNFAHDLWHYSGIWAYIDCTPTVDAVEVVHGKWEDFCGDKMCCCSVCKAEFDNTCNEIHDEWYYCPNCGAKMDLKGETNEG